MEQSKEKGLNVDGFVDDYEHCSLTNMLDGAV